MFLKISKLFILLAIISFFCFLAKSNASASVPDILYNPKDHYQNIFLLNKQIGLFIQSYEYIDNPAPTPGNLMIEKPKEFLFGNILENSNIENIRYHLFLESGNNISSSSNFLINIISYESNNIIVDDNAFLVTASTTIGEPTIINFPISKFKNYKKIKALIITPESDGNFYFHNPFNGDKDSFFEITFKTSDTAKLKNMVSKLIYTEPDEKTKIGMLVSDMSDLKNGKTAIRVKTDWWDEWYMNLVWPFIFYLLGLFTKTIIKLIIDFRKYLIVNFINFYKDVIYKIKKSKIFKKIC